MCFFHRLFALNFAASEQFDSGSEVRVEFIAVAVPPSAMDCLDFLAISGLRKDGRRPDEVRRVRCRLGRSSSAGAHGARVDGSAYLEMGLTKVLALVSGPHEARRSAEQHDRATIACTCSLASFAGPERKRRRTADAGGDRGGSGSDRQLAEVALAMQRTLETAVVISACVDQRVRALRDRI